MKHPVISDRTRLLVWWLVLLTLSLGQFILYYIAYGGYTAVSIPDAIVSYIIISGIGLSLWYPFRYFNTGNTSVAANISNILASGAISVILWSFLTKLVVMAVIRDTAVYQEYWKITLPYRLSLGVFIYSLFILTYYLFESLSRLSEKNAREARLESLVRETELKMLRSQINPHFLFNSLNSISSLTITDPEKARDMVIKLSDFMRYSLSRKDEQPVTFRSELESLRAYLEIEKVRFGDKLATIEKIDSNTLDIKMPVMLLQPLYENAIKHGVYESTDKVTITTEASQSDGILGITISNNYEDGMAALKGTATGLLNVSRRLELFYGTRGNLVTNRENGIFTVKLFIPV